MIDRVGQQLGSYRLIRSLGSGGFADVYLGEHIYMNTQAAIKILQARLAQNDLQAFLAEARTIANLNHRNIVQVFDFAVEKDTPFLVMAYAPNGTLRQRHPGGSRLSLQEVVSYIRQVADALQYAHTRKVIHRDIKPENMLVGQNGDILLSDFGIAVVTQSSRYGSQEVGGTVAYMAPEQLQGRAGPASDQYALAIVVYEWLAGVRPFNGSFAEIGSQHLFTAPPLLREKVPELPPAVEQIIQTALNKNPQQRFQNIQAFANALAQANEASQRSGTAGVYDRATQTSENQRSTFINLPSNSAYPPMGNPTGNNPGYIQQPGNTRVPPPPPGHLPSDYNRSVNTPAMVSDPGRSLNTPRLNSASMIPEQLSSQPPINNLPETKRRGNRGPMIAIIALVIILVAVTSAGATYLFANRQASNTTTGAQVHPTATSPQTSASTTSTDMGTATPTTQGTATVNATTPTATTPIDTVPWGPGTTNKQLICISSCDNNTGTFNVTLSSIVVDTTHNTMQWNFTIQNNGNVCNNLYGRIDLVDPAGTKFSADGGTFTEYSPINSGQILPKTATFSTLPKPGVLYEVQINAGCYAASTYQPEHFQR